MEVLGISPGAFQVDVEHKLWSIGSLDIVSLGVFYKYILALVLSEELWNCTKFVTPYFFSVYYGLLISALEEISTQNGPPKKIY